MIRRRNLLAMLTLAGIAGMTFTNAMAQQENRRSSKQKDAESDISKLQSEIRVLLKIEEDAGGPNLRLTYDQERFLHEALHRSLEIQTKKLVEEQVGIQLRQTKARHLKPAQQDKLKQLLRTEPVLRHAGVRQEIENLLSEYREHEWAQEEGTARSAYEQLKLPKMAEWAKWTNQDRAKAKIFEGKFPTSSLARSIRRNLELEKARKLLLENEVAKKALYDFAEFQMGIVATLPYPEQQRFLETMIQLVPDHPKIAEAKKRLNKWGQFAMRVQLEKSIALPTEFPKYDIKPDDAPEVVLKKSHHDVLVQRISAIESAYQASGGPDLQDVITAYQDLLRAELALGQGDLKTITTYKMIVKNLGNHEMGVQALYDAQRRGGDAYWLATIKSARLQAEIVLLDAQRKSQASWPNSLECTGR